jgi:hypothetical protein
MSTVGARKRRNSLGSKRLHKHRDQGRQSDAAVEADRERSRAYQRYKRKVAQQTQQELANAKEQLAILRRQINHLEALNGELEAHIEHGHVPDAMAADLSEEDEFLETAGDPVDDCGAVGGWNADDVEMVIERLKKGSHKRFKALFGLTSEGIAELLEDVARFIENTTMKGKEKKPKAGKDEYRLSDALQLHVGLYWLRRYPTFDELSALFAIPVMFAKKVVVRIVHALARAAQQLPRAKGGLGWPTKAELDQIRREQSTVKVPNMAPDFAIDGMHIKIKKPAGVDDEELKKFWNGKHKCWCLMVIVVTDLRGRPVYISDPLRGGEWRVVLDLNIKEKCREIVGDALYCFNRATDERADDITSYFTLGPTSVSRLRTIAGDNSLDPQVVDWAKRQLRSTKAASRVRVVVENGILGFRHEKAVTRDEAFRHFVANAADRPTYYLDPAAVVRAATLIAARKMLLRPPRAVNWTPQQDAAYGYDGAPLNAKNVERRVRELFKELKPRVKHEIDKDDDDDDDDSEDASAKQAKRRARPVDRVIDWKEYEEDGDFLVVPQKMTTARQLAKAAGEKSSEKVTSAYAGLDVAERKKRKGNNRSE